MLRVTERGAGVTLDITSLTSDDLYEAVTRVIEDYSFTENARSMSRIHRDKAMTPLEAAVFWIEYTIRTKGAFHLRPAAHNLYWYQYLMLDSIALIFAVLYVLYRFLPTTLRFIFSSSLRLKLKTE
ncbi:Oidioi.mRNA.OKI2018_I69.XSR.g14831.t1.cds [Oikopleura dioica]|uniref:Oidioi.mRNA.OKI2018_I69.XSR.g14831.t1.cds n=1 Tax=Oikopleura dioica TaxID=34765 RepID=A0ABN7SEV0_OIKDI|nr:Oidioi.mRNA.OKI2018_I69.XSR.g14831.t1.cds [Oikopleura dioica]